MSQTSQCIQPTMYKFFYFKIEIKTKVDLYMSCKAMGHSTKFYFLVCQHSYVQMIVSNICFVECNHSHIQTIFDFDPRPHTYHIHHSMCTPWGLQCQMCQTSQPNHHCCYCCGFKQHHNDSWAARQWRTRSEERGRGNGECYGYRVYVPYITYPFISTRTFDIESLHHFS